MPIEQFCLRLTGQIAQTLPFYQQPFVECRVAQIVAIQQIAAIKCRRPREILHAAVADQPLELRDINRDRGSLQAHEVTIGEQRRRLQSIE